MLLNQEYKIFRCTDHTEEQYDHKSYYNDEYGSLQSEIQQKWRPFKSESYYVQSYAANFYSDCSDVYYPFAPSGKYHHRYGTSFQKVLRKMELVGSCKNLDFDIPYRYTSVYELEPLDVFELEEDHAYYNFRTPKIKSVVPSKVPLVIDSFSDSEHIFVHVYEMESKKKHKLYNDLAVNKIGRIKIVHEFVKD
jgi:hypothetical protein